jgi:3-deoxy-D-manno-octulosonate 8-phosphate phosphatase KdsC-like HAD superfamily phosphatase
MDEHKLKDKAKTFIVKDGTALESIKDLYGHLSIITEEHFRHHVNEQKNDFAIWIEDAHGDKFLAAAVRQSPTKEGMRKVMFIAMFR